MGFWGCCPASCLLVGVQRPCAPTYTAILKTTTGATARTTCTKKPKNVIVKGVRIYCMWVCPLTFQAIAAIPKRDFAPMLLVRGSLGDLCCFGVLGLLSCFVFACGRPAPMCANIHSHSQDNHRRNSKDNLHQKTEKCNCQGCSYLLHVGLSPYVSSDRCHSKT